MLRDLRTSKNQLEMLIKNASRFKAQKAEQQREQQAAQPQVAPKIEAISIARTIFSKINLSSSSLPVLEGKGA